MSVQDTPTRRKEKRLTVDVEIVGLQGMGKTTLARELEAWFTARGFEVDVDDEDESNVKATVLAVHRGPYRGAP